MVKKRPAVFLAAMLALAIGLGGCTGGNAVPKSTGAASLSISEEVSSGATVASSSESGAEPDVKPAPSAVRPEVDSSSSTTQMPSSPAASSAASSSASVADGMVQPEVMLAEAERVHAETTVELNLRKGPGTDYERIEILPENTMLVELGYSESTPDWLYVTAYLFTDNATKEVTGWVAKEYVEAIEGGLAKPVVYLYPTCETDVRVQVKFAPGYGFTCTYPAYGNGWSVTARPDGTLVNHADGMEYSYLYWEGAGPAAYDMSSGFVVKGSDSAAFLQEKLAYLGLTPKEYNEFIVYWLPRMQANPYNLITFQGAAYTDKAALVVTPRPDSMLRVFMVYQPLEQPVDVPEQALEPFERSGFAVVEWGGARLGAQGAFG